MGGVTRRVLTFVIAVLAIGAIVYAAQLAQTGDDVDEPVLSGADVEALIPPRNSEILAQEPLGIDLAPGYTGVLIVNGIEIPEDQLIRRNGLDEILYRPSGDDAAVEYVAGENCVVALVWPVEESRLEARTVSWCFNVT
jgi:hypothetical protein